MREIAIASQVEKKDIIDYLHANIQTKLDFCSPIITNYCDNNFCYFLLAFDEEYTSACEGVLREIIIEYIETVYKIEYLKSKIKNPIADKLTFAAYIKVLSVFDRNTDESALRKIILFNQTFFLDSFLDFRLSPLKLHWDNLAELSSDNATMFNSGTFVDVIKFLINTMDSEVYKVKVICNRNKFSVYNMKNKNSRIKKTNECNTSIDLISSVLNVCPNYVDVYVNTNSNDEAISFLSNVFANRLKIYTKN